MPVPLLVRQLHHAGLQADAVPTLEQWRGFLDTIDRAYSEAEQDRYTTERVLAISSREMRELYDNLERSSKSQLAELNWFLDSIVENIPHMVFVKDAVTLKFVRFNRAGEELLGWPRTALIGKSDYDFFPKEQAEFFIAEDRKVLAQRGVVTIAEEPIETRNGKRWLRTKKIPIVDGNGVAVYLLGISEDITDALAKQAELLLAKETAEKASRAKSDFLRNMSHEMRTPLNAILGFGRVLERQNRSPASTEMLGYVVQASEHMLALVNDLLDLRRIEESKPTPVEFALGPVLEETAAMMRSLLDERDVALILDIASDLPAVFAERRAVVQILMNLISNAAKFTPAKGSVTLAAVARDGRVHVSVTDTGIGIADEDQGKLFTYFEQVGGKHAHHMSGSGVGLALTRSLVERLGGEITVHSMPGQGSTFDFHLRAATS